MTIGVTIGVNYKRSKNKPVILALTHVVHKAEWQGKEVDDEEARRKPRVGYRDGRLVDAFAASQHVLKSREIQIHGHLREEGE